MLKKLPKWAITQFVSVAFDKPLAPPTRKDQELVEELKATFREFSYADTNNSSPSEKAWLSYANKLRELVLTQDPREFIRWDIILYTMFVGYARYIYTELQYLKNHPKWEQRWRGAIDEAQIGHPIPYWGYSRSSGNLIHHAYHVAQFEDKTGLPIDRLDFIFEFGGGYGSMCRLVHNLGFKGKYIIFDFPEFAALQRFFLKSLDIPVQTPDTFGAAKNGVVSVSSLEQLETLLDEANLDHSLFIATWSISEVPIDLRNKILPLVSRFKSFLIAYQYRFKEVDNLAYFNQWQDSQGEIEWKRWKIEHLPHDNYLVGQRKN